MNDELQKLQEVQHLNDQLLLENKRLQAHNIELANELNNLKAQPDSSELQQKLTMQEERFRNHLIQIKKYTKGLLGYDMEINEDTVELLSLYAFERNDKVVFQVSGKNLNLMSNEFIDEYKELVDMYLVKGKSIPAFLSGITMDLVNKKTFQ